MIFKKNQTIGPYEVMFQHNQGMGVETYRVKGPDGKTHFLKLVDMNRVTREQVDENGELMEIRISQGVKHPNIPNFIDAGRIINQGSQYAYLVTEFVSGETLYHKLVREGNLTVYELKEIAKSILAALQCLHSQPIPIIHNYITSHSILLDFVYGLQSSRLINFRYSCLLDQPLVKPDLFNLNPFYLAPERFSGVCGVRSDLFSVGAVMYEALYGQLPWFVDLSNLNYNERADAVLGAREKELAIPHIEKFELDEQLVNTIIKSLSYDAEDRFESAEEFIKAIDGETKVARPETKRQIKSEAKPKEAFSAQISEKRGEGFAAIAGMDELKNQLREEVIEPLHNPEEYKKYGVTIPNGMLLYGPPGCGKTFFAKHFAEEVGFNFICMTPASLKSRWVNATQENIAAMFKEAEEKSPIIIFIDEINELIPDRQSDVHEMSRGAVNEMLAQMDRTGEKGIFIIGATNYPHMIDRAMLRAGRLENKYYVGVPDTEGRKAIFKLYLSKRPYDFGIDYEKLAGLTQNYVSADIQLIVNVAARKALREKGRITMALIEKAIEETSPSLNAKELAGYEQIRREMEESYKPGNTIPKIGFR